VRARLALLLGAATLAVFARAVVNGFISFDDGLTITANRHVLGGLSWAGLRWALTSFDASNWHPVTWLSHMIDVSLFGTDPAGHHAVNVVFHAANAVLVLLLFERLTGSTGRSAAVAALFALHPLRVESVAWASQRKDVLAVFFGLLALLAYVRAVRPQAARGFGMAAVLFALGLMAKPTLVSLPLLMLLLDVWPLDRLRPKPRKGKDKGVAPITARDLVVEKLPFFVLAAASSALTFTAQVSGGATSALPVPLAVRCDNAVVSVARYLVKTLAPVDLAVLYPHPRTPQGWKTAGAALLLAGISAACVFGERRHPYLLFGWLWFSVALLPTVGLVQVGWQSMADRYTYLPSIGLAVLAVWGASEAALHRPALKPAFAACLAVALAALSALTFRQIGAWKDSLTLWGAALSATRNNPIAELNYGGELLRVGRTEEAIAHLEAGRRLEPASPEPVFSLGAAYASLGRTQEARREYEEAIRLRPDFSAAHGRLGEILAAEGRWSEALPHFEALVRLAPASPEAHFNLAIGLESAGRRGDAIRELRRAVELDPAAAPPAAELRRLLAEDAAAAPPPPPRPRG
jgi:tetratricopeptide (TPR) repeat protein